MPTSRRTSFPISFPPIFFQRTKAPSASLAPSTAEGRPVQLTNPKDDHHTSALQKLNSKYPSVLRRHGYTPEAPGAQSSTYSQPVLVRTYSGPPPSQGSRSTRSRQYRPPSSGRGVSRRVPLPSGSAPGSAGPGRPIQPTVSDVGVGTTSSSSAEADRHATAETRDRSVYGANMPRPYKAKKPTAATSSSKLPLGWPWLSSRQEPEEPKLPPLEAFSFKSFMADLQTPGGDNDIGADLDRIAEICARSRYSLSNQYEVHVAPHGSGTAFMSGVGPSPSSAPRRKGHSRSRSHGHGGPTLQAITSDDENSTRSNPRKRNPGKRRNTAYGTLETIMSSSRSSEEDKSKKKSASALVGEVRGRAAKKAWGNSTSSASASASASTPESGSADTQSKQPQDPATTTSPTTANSPTDPTRLARKKSASFATAIMDTSSRTSAKASSSSSSRQRRATLSTPSALLSEPARPQTSNSHLGVRTTPTTPPPPPTPSLAGQQRQQRPRPVIVAELGGEGLPHQQQDAAATAAAGNAGWSAWVPWRSGSGSGAVQAQETAAGPSHAEGRLRLLLRTATGETGKGVGQVV